jgi:ATP-dependent RNA helicase DDX5/DBP2
VCVLLSLSRCQKREKRDTFHAILEAINTDADGVKLAQQAKILIFTGTKRFCAELSQEMLRLKYNSACIHGDMEQWQRDTVLRRFRGNQLRILVATDVAARGLDISDIEYVINYDLPHNMEDYIHRIGRTGRAGKFGTAYSLFVGDVDKGNAKELAKILAQAGAEVPAEVAQLALRRGGGGGGGGRWGGGKGRRGGKGGGKGKGKGGGKGSRGGKGGRGGGGKGRGGGGW